MFSGYLIIIIFGLLLLLLLFNFFFSFADIHTPALCVVCVCSCRSPTFFFFSRPLFLYFFFCSLLLLASRAEPERRVKVHRLWGSLDLTGWSTPLRLHILAKRDTLTSSLARLYAIATHAVAGPAIIRERARLTTTTFYSAPRVFFFIPSECVWLNSSWNWSNLNLKKKIQIIRNHLPLGS